MNQSNWTVGEYLWHQVKSLGITKVPGIPGDVILPLMDQGYESGIEFIGCENEQNAGYIGDGMARQHGVAAFITTTAVGSLSAFNATASSAAEKVGVIHISGGLPSHLYAKRELVHHSIGGELYKNREAFKVITNGRAEVLLDPETAPDIIDSLLTYSATYSEPCFIEVPVDIGAKPCRAPEPLLSVVETSDPRSVQQAKSALTQFISDKPNRLLIPGFLLKRLKLEKEAQQLLDETGLPFTTLLTDKGLFSERHPQFCGTYLGVASAIEFQDFFNESDLYINLGCWLTDIQSICGSVEMPAAKTVIVHENALEIGGERFEKIPMIESINLLQQVLGVNNDRTHPQAEQMQAYAGQFNRPMQESLSVDGFFEMLSTAIQSEDHIVVEAGTALFSGCGLLLPEGLAMITQPSGLQLVRVQAQLWAPH
ncbi:thiamine pyrophosphate-binding protein [Dongshaea marina]|uniref:thiamine pyrophosphate-binding protein n=1 Tax=Dongshaea marina TaxID=2047966 RepID=UPI000D3E57DB|nr:thiamine pyrophosphate-binding protein [Dongshaea marina]